MKPHPPFYNVRTNETIPAGNNLNRECLKRGLDQSTMRRLCRPTRPGGKALKSYRGWVVGDKHEIPSRATPFHKPYAQSWHAAVAARRGKPHRPTPRTLPMLLNVETGEVIPEGMTFPEFSGRFGANAGGLVAKHRPKIVRGWVAVKHPLVGFGNAVSEPLGVRATEETENNSA